MVLGGLSELGSKTDDDYGESDPPESHPTRHLHFSGLKHASHLETELSSSPLSNQAP